MIKKWLKWETQCISNELYCGCWHPVSVGCVFTLPLERKCVSNCTVSRVSWPVSLFSWKFICFFFNWSVCSCVRACKRPSEYGTKTEQRFGYWIYSWLANSVALSPCVSCCGRYFLCHWEWSFMSAPLNQHFTFVSACSNEILSQTELFLQASQPVSRMRLSASFVICLHVSGNTLKAGTEGIKPPNRKKKQWSGVVSIAAEGGLWEQKEQLIQTNEEQMVFKPTG